MNESFIQLEILGVDGRESKIVLGAGGAIKIGSGADCDVVIAHPDVAPCQARLLLDQEVVILEPAGAADTRGTVRLDGEPITASTDVRAGQEIAVGPAVFVWQWLPKEEWPTMPGSGTEDRRQSAVFQLADELKKGRYRAGSEVGRGGMGRILQAEETPLRRPVAMKVLLTSGKGQRHAEERFIREARVTGGLQHPSIVPVHELNVDETGRVFYTMKLVKGVTLREVLSRLSKGDPEARRSHKLSSLLTIFQKVCDAVAFAHAQPNPIIHRDLKPDNIMVGEYGEVLVMDWGLAKLLGRDDPADDEKHTANGDAPDKDDSDISLLVTQPGTAMGTPGYMAPEQARGQADMADERTDIYALGAILYALLTLESPVRITAKEAHDFHERWQRGEQVTQNFRGYVAPVLTDRSIRKKLDHLPGRTVPDSLVAVVLKAMALRPEHRFESVKKLQADVAAYQAGFATSAEEARPWRRFTLLVARNKILFGAIATTFVILLTATLISLRQRHVAVTSNRSLQLTLHSASQADHETANQRFLVGKWREGLALLGRSLTFWPENREAANYLLSAIALGQGDDDKLPVFGVYHHGEVGEAAFSPDGTLFVTASRDATARIWNSATGMPTGKPLSHSEPVLCARFSPDGRKVVTTDEGGSARVWDAQTGAPITKPMLHGKPDLDSRSAVGTGIFSPDGGYVVTTSYDHTTRVWSSDSGEQVAEMLNRQRAADVRFSPDGSLILGTCWRGAQLWDAKTFQPIGPFMNHGKTVRRAMFTPDGSKIVSGDLKNKIRIWDGHTAQPLVPFINVSEAVWDLDVSPDGKLFATACWGKTARLWSFEDASPKGVAMEHEGPVDSAVFSPKGDRLLTSSRDKTVRLWDVATCKQIGNPMRHDETVLKAIFNPDGSKILSAGADNTAYLWDAAPPHWPGEVIPVPGEICSLEFDKNDDSILVATRDGQMGLWSLEKKQFVTPTIRQGSAISVAGFHLSSKQIATAGSDGIIRFWDVISGKTLGETAATNDRIIALEFATNGKSVFSAHIHGTVLQWKIPEATQIGEAIKLSENMNALAVAPNGDEIATGAGDDLFQFWDPSTGNSSRKQIKHSTSANVLSYHPDGHLIAVGCEDHTARIWSLDTGEQQKDSFYLAERVTAVRFTPNGNALFVGSRESTQVNCYDVRTHDSLCVPLAHPTGVSNITTNADGSLVISLTTDGVARLWRIPTTSESPPKWLPDYVRALGGLAFTSQQQLIQVSMRERLRLRKELLSRPPENSIWDKMMRWSFKRTETGAADPWSPATK